MARAYTFAEFDERLKSGRLTPQEIADYLELDPDAVVVRVRFRPGTLLDEPPPGYDIDAEFAAYQARKLGTAARSLATAGIPRVVAAGDSWFLMPTFIPGVPAAIAQWLQISGSYAVWHVGRWGKTLREILHEREYPDAIQRRRPDWFIVSAGGNDIQEALQKGAGTNAEPVLFKYEPTRPLEQSLTPAGESMLQQVGEDYRRLLADVRQISATLPIVCYGYDYPRPEVGNGRHIGRHLTRDGYPREKQRPLMKIVLDRLKGIIEQAVGRFSNTAFLNCLSVTDRYTWFNDMHPADDGFKALAAKFEKHMERVPEVMPRASRKKTTRRRSGARARPPARRRRAR